MLILGTTADDKGAQLEALVHTILTAEGYQNIRRNEIREGGNELDVVAERISLLVGAPQVTQVICEAKAYADPVSSPNWQRFLGKLFLARTEDNSTVGVFIALNGVNGNVSGSYKSLRRRDQAVILIDGTTLETRAMQSGELLSESHAKASITALYHREPAGLESAYYGGIWRWLARWGNGDYSIVGGRGELIAAAVVEELRPALESSVAGVLVTAEDAQIFAEARHATRLKLFSKLFYGLPVSGAGDTDSGDVARELSTEPFCEVADAEVVLRSPASMEAAAICRLFKALFQNNVRLEYLAFIADGLLAPYVQRLIDLIPEIQSGFTLDEPSQETLRGIAPLFPSIWMLLAEPIEFIVTHRDLHEERSEMLFVDRNAFWETISQVIQADFANPALRGFLYEHMGVVELEEERSVRIKTKSGPLASVQIEVRNGIGQLSDELVGEAGTRHMMLRLLPGAEEPWERNYPDPTIELKRPCAPDSDA